MREQEVRELYEAYMQVHQPKEEVEQLDEDIPKQVGDLLKSGGDELRKRLPVVAAVLSPAGKGKGTVTAPQQKQKISQNVPLKNSFDPFDAILEHLVAEGYADTNESALAIMANMSEEWRQDIMEISQKTAIGAFAKRATDEFETDSDNPRDFTKSGKSKADETKRRVDRKFGKKAGEHADRAAHAGIFGRKSSLMPKKPT